MLERVTGELRQEQEDADELFKKNISLERLSQQLKEKYNQSQAKRIFLDKALLKLNVRNTVLEEQVAAYSVSR